MCAFDFCFSGPYRRTKLSFVTQKDNLYETLTVREIVTYASQMYNAKRDYSRKDARPSLDAVAKAVSIEANYDPKKFDAHFLITSNVIRKLGLEACANTTISEVSHPTVRLHLLDC